MKEKLKKYVDKFNKDDNEYYKQDVDNENAYEWLAENIPLIEIPDKTIEEIYYFRWWVFRKHIKKTEDGYVITEFLPPDPWGGKHNTIIAAAGHHIDEAKWLKNCKEITDDYITFFMEEKTKTYLYSSWLIWSYFEYSAHINDYNRAIELLPLFVNYYNKVKNEHITEEGLMWSVDNNDAMEYSISGTTSELQPVKGIRPTLNSYMAANALAISKLAKLNGDKKLSCEFYSEYETLKNKINDTLWDKDFYKAKHNDNPECDVKELIGYIPWCFNLPPLGREDTFRLLLNDNGFNSPYGFTTAEKTHSRYLYSNPTHECLWNGYIWPFATSQTLNAVLNLIDNYSKAIITCDDFYSMLKTYAKSHYLTENGKTVCWIDEVKDPCNNEWSSRNILKEWGWLYEKGGKERGKDYNHSTFCDLVLKGLLGIGFENGEIKINPHLPSSISEFRVENLWNNGEKYKINYKNGMSTIDKE